MWNPQVVVSTMTEPRVGVCGVWVTEFRSPPHHLILLHMGGVTCAGRVRITTEPRNIYTPTPVLCELV